MAIVQRQWNNEVIEMEEEWLERAKALVREQGHDRVLEVIRALAEEMGLQSDGDLAVRAVVLAINELGQIQFDRPSDPV